MESSVAENIENPSEIKRKTQFVGKVVKIGLAGAVVDIGIDTPAALHVSQILAPENEPIKRVEDVLEIGQEIEVWVRKVKDARVELTMKKPLDLEWRDIKKDMVVKGKVVRLETFGAFVDVGAERPGLIHISELAHGYVRTPSEVVKEGDEVEAMIIEVLRRKKQIKLSIKALEPEPEIEATVITADQQDNPRFKGDKGRRKKGRRKDGDQDAYSSSESEASDESLKETALGIKLREALEKSQDDAAASDDKNKKGKNISKEQEDILARTLEHRVPTS
jgi:small subunit ribosomal protein S1